jgi:hypothetical protein
VQLKKTGLKAMEKVPRRSSLRPLKEGGPMMWGAKKEAKKALGNLGVWNPPAIFALPERRGFDFGGLKREGKKPMKRFGVLKSIPHLCIP